MRMLGIAIVLALAACGQPTSESTPAATTESAISADAQTQALLAVVTPVIATELGVPVSLEASQVRVMNEWAWVVATPRQANGAPMDWAATTRASAYENGVMDESGATYALLKQEGGAWRIVAHTIAPTDVAWESWPTEYGAPRDLFGLPPAP